LNGVFPGTQKRKKTRLHPRLSVVILAAIGEKTDFFILMLTSKEER